MSGLSIMQRQPRRRGCLFLVSAPWSRNRTAKFADLPIYSRSFSAEFGLHQSFKVFVGNQAPFQAIGFGGGIEHFAKQNSFGGMRANVEIADARDNSATAAR